MNLVTEPGARRVALILGDGKGAGNFHHAHRAIPQKQASGDGYLQPITPAQQQQLKIAGAQAITYLMPALHSAPRWLCGGHDTLAVRLTAHKQAAQLCRGVNRELVATSANRSGQRPARTYAQCQRLFGRKVWVLPGRVGKHKKPSTISMWADGKIIRS